MATVVVALDETNRREVDDRSRERFVEVFGHEPDADREALVQFVRERWEERDVYMQARFHRWVYQIRFAAGEQWLISTDGKAYFEPPAPDGSIRVTRNLTGRAVQYRISKLTESRPIPKVLPHSNEVQDADRAEAAQQLVEHLDRVLDMGLLWDEGLWYDALCGCAFYYIGWESDTGEFVRAKKARLAIDEMGEPTIEEYFVDANGNEVESISLAHAYRTGDISLQVVPPWAIRVSNPELTDPRRQRYWLWGQVLDVQEIKRRFGEAADEITGSDDYSQQIYYQELVSGWAERGFNTRPGPKTGEARALVIQYFEKPSREFPKGRHIVVCDDVMLHYGPLPFGNDEIGYHIPFVRLQSVGKLGDFYGEAVIEDMIPVQKTINQLESHALEYIRLFSRGGLTAEYGTVIEESWSDDFGTVLYYQGERPSPISWPGMPSDVWQALDRAYENFDRISGWADVARGGVPPGVKAARAILELKRSNDTPLGKALQRFDRAVEQVTTQIVNRARWGYIEPHWIDILGADVPHMVRAVTRDDLPTHFSVKIETDSILRLSYPAKLELLFELSDRQMIDQTEAKRLLNFADWEHQSGQWHRDYARARTKIERLLAGEPVTVEWWEDDVVHMRALEERMKDPRYDMLEPWQQQALSQLWTEHYGNWMMKQQGGLPPQLQQALAGGGDGMPQLTAGPDAPAMLPGAGGMIPEPTMPAPSSRPPEFAGAAARFNPLDVSATEAAAGF